MHPSSPKLSNLRSSPATTLPLCDCVVPTWTNPTTSLIMEELLLQGVRWYKGLVYAPKRSPKILGFTDSEPSGAHVNFQKRQSRILKTPIIVLNYPKPHIRLAPRGWICLLPKHTKQPFQHLDQLQGARMLLTYSGMGVYERDHSLVIPRLSNFTPGVSLP